jgi:hypothetical protein
MNSNWFIFGTAEVNGFRETVFLKKNGDLEQDVEKDDLMLFSSDKEAIAYAEKRKWDAAEFAKVDDEF